MKVIVGVLLFFSAFVFAKETVKSEQSISDVAEFKTILEKSNTFRKKINKLERYYQKSLKSKERKNYAYRTRKYQQKICKERQRKVENDIRKLDDAKFKKKKKYDEVLKVLSLELKVCQALIGKKKKIDIKKLNYANSNYCLKKLRNSCYNYILKRNYKKRIDLLLAKSMTKEELEDSAVRTCNKDKTEYCLSLLEKKENMTLVDNIIYNFQDWSSLKYNEKKVKRTPVVKHSSQGKDVVVKNGKAIFGEVSSEYLVNIHYVEKSAIKAAKEKRWKDSIVLAKKAFELSKQKSFEGVKNDNINCKLHTSNIILGANALNEGRPEEAGEFLLKSLDSKSLNWIVHFFKTKEKLKSHRPCVSFDFWTPDTKLALKLLEKGHKNVVVKYLNKMRQITVVNDSWLKDADIVKWLEVISKGLVPHKDTEGPLESYIGKHTAMSVYSVKF